MACSRRDYGGYLTDDCRKIGQSYSPKFTYVGYHAVQSGWEDRYREDVNLYLPIDETASGDDWRGPCEDIDCLGLGLTVCVQNFIDLLHCSFSREVVVTDEQVSE